jgi:DNA replication protein DnaC
MTLTRQSFLTTPEEIESLRDSIIGKFCKNKCDGKGAILEKGVFTNCTCVVEFEKKLRLIQANIPKKYWDFDLRNLTKEYSENNKIPLAIIKSYTSKIKEMVEKGIGLYIQGTVGLAKTALSYYILKEAIKQDIVCYSISMSRLTQLLFGISVESNKDRIDWIINRVDLLVIEEIEKDYNVEKSNTFIGALVNDFFRSVYDNKKALLINSNLSKQGLRDSKVHAHNITDRFEELVDIVLTGHSYRKQDENLKQILG